MLDHTAEQALEDVALLAEPVRRRLFLYVLAQPEAVSREAAAAAVRVTRSLAAFHLDRLVAAGLLQAEFRRLSGRTGPGAGRPSKLYRASGRELKAELPERRYEVAAELFAAALSAPEAGPKALHAAAGEYGRELGQEAQRRAGSSAGAAQRFAALESVLRDAGYIPFRREGPLPRAGEIRLLNCPFHDLAQRHRELTCGMNLALLQGLLAGSDLPATSARLDPTPGLCCVAIDPESPQEP